jgi:predicted MFS family arabinose efflux permease
VISLSRIYLINRCLCSPLETLFTLLIFILSKNLNATPIQLTLLACLKPITSFFAYYMSSHLFNKTHRIRRYLIFNTILGCTPTFLFPFVQNIWFYIASYAIFMVTWRAGYPAWIEILKNKLETDTLRQIISRGTSIHYFVMIFFPPLVCFWMDIHENLWRYLFFSCALLKLTTTLFILKIDSQDDLKISKINFSLSHVILDPLRKGWSVLKETPAFVQYQILFFLGGAGIILSQPILPVYFKENLNITYSQLALAFSVCKGISFVLTSPFWVKITNRISIYQLNVYVDLLSCLFFASILASNFATHWIFLAYLFYGSMQAGCEMSWNLSGPIFSENKESTIYSSINLACIGLRGCICPFLGHFLLVYTNANVVFVIGGLLCFIGLIYGLWLDRSYKTAPDVSFG